MTDLGSSAPGTRARAAGAPPASVPSAAGVTRAPRPWLRRAHLTRRGLQAALGLLWLADGALQLQPIMLSTRFARQIISPAGDGQPAFVGGPVHWAARLIAAYPVAWDLPFAMIQLLLGLGLLYPRTAKLALAASLPWALGVWYLGEGLGGIASGSASLLTGAPGAVLLYAVLTLAAWPRRDRPDVPPPRWLTPAWAALWAGGGVLQAPPPTAAPAAVASAIGAGASTAPPWLASLDSCVAAWFCHHGSAVYGLIAVEALVGLAALIPKGARPAAVAGLVLALAAWIIPQDFGQIPAGQATDPNSAPLIALMAIALIASPGVVFSGSSTSNCEPAVMTDLNNSAKERGLPAPPPPPRRAGTPRIHARTALVTAIIAVLAAGGGYAIARGAASSPAPAASPAAAASPATPATGGSNPGTSMGGGGSSGFSSSSLAQSIGQQVGTAMADLAPQTVSLAQTRTLGDQVPADASVDRASNTITFTASSVSFTVVAVPPGGPDMTFRVPGLTDPGIVVPQDAQVTVQFINGDNDEAHAWMIADEQPPFSFYQPKTPAIPGAFSGLIGDPTANGQGASTSTFQAGPAGTYQYICPMPGHAQMGMHGAFIVR